ncbi:ROK family protein [Nocardiopsis coralliicola]
MPPQDGPLLRLRRSHVELVLTLLRRHGPLSRGRIGELSGLSRTTLSAIVADLIGTGAVVAAAPEAARRTRGRPVETLTLNPAAGRVVGIDFARRAVHVAAVNVAHEVIGTASQTHAADLPRRDRVELAGRLVSGLGGADTDLRSVTAVGVGAVGPVPDTGGAAPSTRDPESLAGLVGAAFSGPVLIDNNTRLAALAEATWGAAAGSREVVYIRLSHGVGGGLVVGGSLHRGPRGLSGEFGHITAVPGGAPCQCGGRGCLETAASVGAVLERYRAAGGTAAGSAAFAQAAREGEAAARAVLAEAGERIGTVLAGLCNAVGPGRVVVGGELAAAGAALFDPVEAALRAHLMPISRPWVDLQPARLGETAGALGAIALVLHDSPLLSHYSAHPATEEDS